MSKNNKADGLRQVMKKLRFKNADRLKKRLMGVRPLQRRLVLWMISAIVLAITITGLSFILVIYRAEQSLWQERQAETAYGAAQSVSFFLQSAVDNLKLVSTASRDYLQANPEFMQNLLFSTSSILEAIRVDGEGATIQYVSQGRPALAEQITIPQTQWFITARTGQTSISNIRLSAQDDPDLIVAIPASGGDVVAARINMKMLQQTMVDTHNGKTGGVYVINSNGQIIAHPQLEIVLNNTNIRERYEFEKILGAPGKVWKGGHQNLLGQRVVSASAPIAGTSWIAIAELSATEAYNATRLSSVMLALWIVFATCIAIIVVGNRLNSVLFVPMEKLRETAERIGKGDLSARASLPQKDEIGMLAASFDAMAEQLMAHERQLNLQSSRLEKEVNERRKVAEDLRKLSRELELRVQERTSELVHEINERKKVEEELFYRSTHDSLTGLYNRHFYVEEMKRFETSRQYPISLVMVDIDDLKLLNDSLGHSAGDEYLSKTASLLKSVFRAEDIVARIGGDEFAVLLPNTDEAGVARAVERIHALVAKQTVMNNFPFFSLSIGAATAQTGESLQEVYRRADEKMYQEKQLKHSNKTIRAASMHTGN